MTKEQAKDKVGNSPEVGDIVAIAVSTSTRNAEQLIGEITELVCTDKQVKATVKVINSASWYTDTINIVFNPWSTKTLILNKYQK